MRGIFGIDPAWGNTIVRVVLGLIFIAAGWQKLAGGVDAVSGSFAKMGIPAAELAGPLVVGLELVGGTLLLLGLAGRWIAALFAAQFVVATFYVTWPNRGFAGARLDLLILASSLLIVLAGPGRAALDSLWLERGARLRAPSADDDLRRIA